jgi:hypothetical protein
MLDVRQIQRMNRHPVETDEEITPASILDTEEWLNWNCDLDNPNDTEDDCAADTESDIKHGNGIEDPECPLQRDVSATLKVP